MLCFVSQDCLLDHMEICVTEAEKRETGALNIRDFYTVYLVETKLVNLAYESSRFSSFLGVWVGGYHLPCWVWISSPFIIHLLAFT
jgi:sorting nexin-4